MADETSRWQDKIDAEKAINYLTGDLGSESEKGARARLAVLLRKWATYEDHTSDKGIILHMLAVLIDPLSRPLSRDPREMVIRNRRGGKQPIEYLKQAIVVMEMENAIRAGAKLEEETIPAIAKRLGISRATVWRTWKENKGNFPTNRWMNKVRKNNKF
jgi:hypothetical protein